MGKGEQLLNYCMKWFCDFGVFHYHDAIYIVPWNTWNIFGKHTMFHTIFSMNISWNFEDIYFWFSWCNECPHIITYNRNTNAQLTACVGETLVVLYSEGLLRVSMCLCVLVFYVCFSDKCLWNLSWLVMTVSYYIHTSRRIPGLARTTCTLHILTISRGVN